MTKVMFAGDFHGDTEHLTKCCRVARRNGAELIIQLGDNAAFWPGDDKLERYHNVLAQFDQRMWFLDGNHDDHDRLPHDAPGPVELTDRVTYLPRGHRFELDGVRFLCCGGAVSMDQEQRKPHVSWWPNETISAGDFLRCTDPEDGPVDVLLTHDAPENETLADYLLAVSRRYQEPYKLDGHSKKHRATVTALVEHLQPRLVLHGHYHHRYQDTSTATTVVGLGKNKDLGAWVVLDLERLDEHLAEIRPPEPEM